MSGELTGKRVLIVGGGGDGIGRAITRAVGSAGAQGVVVTGRNLQRVTDAAEEIRGAGTDAFGIPGDVRNVEDIERVVAGTVQKLGGIDILITVVGGSNAYVPWQPLDETGDEHWDLIFDVNVRYVFRYVRAVLKIFLAQGTGGTIASVGSNVGVFGMPMAAAYGAAKAALMSFAKSVAAEYSRRGIRMNVVNSGTVVTDAVRNAIADPAAFFERVPMGRAGTPEEIAQVVLFFASPASAYMTGQTVNVDGGVTSRYPLKLPRTDTSMAG